MIICKLNYNYCNILAIIMNNVYYKAEALKSSPYFYAQDFMVLRRLLTVSGRADIQ